MKNFFPLLLTALFCNVVLAQTPQKKSAASYNFIENKGQVVDLDYKPNPAVLYLFNGQGLNVQLRKTGFSYDVYTVSKTPKQVSPAEKVPSKFDAPEEDIAWHYHRVDIELLGCNTNAVIESRGKSENYINYYTAGTPKEGVTGVYHYTEVYYRAIYNKIDLQFLIQDGKPKYNFILHPGANIADIQLQFNGATETALTPKGEIKITTEQGNVLETIPESYYAGNLQQVHIRFTQLNGNTFGLAGRFDDGKILVVDPTPNRDKGTYFGGNGSDYSTGLSADAAGNLYMGGYTNSTTNIASSGHQFYLAGNNDAFLSKLTKDNLTLVWATYYGGTLAGFGDDRGTGVCVDLSDNIYLSGHTASPNNIGFEGFRDTAVKLTEAFLVKFNSAGVRIWGTYYGGSGNDYGNAVCTDKKGNVYLAGETRSSDYISFNGYQNAFSSTASISDGFLVKFDSAGNRLWGTYYGGTDWDVLFGVCTDGNDNVYVTGYTLSTSMIFLNGHQNYLAGSNDAVIAKYNAGGTLLWSTFYGGTGADIGYNIATDKDSNVYVAGTTSSNQNIATMGWDTIVSGQDVFLVKFKATGSRVWGTYYGGTSTEEGGSIAIDDAGYLYLGGTTSSTSSIANGGYQNSKNSFEDAFCVRFNMDGNLHWASYYGGPSVEKCNALVARDTILYMAGYSNSTSQIATTGTHQPSNGGSNDGFLVKFSMSDIYAKSPTGPFCAGDSIFIDYAYNGTYIINSGNIYRIQLSNASGSFDIGTSILGQLTSTQPTGTIAGFLPATLGKGTAYRIRVYSSNSTVYGTPTDSFTINNIPKADFSSNGTTQCPPGGFIFTNKSTRTGTLFYNMLLGEGDSATFTGNTITKKYINSGVYKIKLLVSGSDYVCQSSKELTITVLDKPTASFTMVDTLFCLGDTIELINTSTTASGTLTYQWTYGPYSSTQKDRKTKFNANGNFDARLIAKANGCVDTATMPFTVGALPKANFTINYISRCLNGNQVGYINGTTIVGGDALSFNWLFGDADTSSQLNPVDNTTKAGLQAVKLMAITEKGCKDSITQNITINPSPAASFTINNDTQCFNNHQFVFTNTSAISTGTLAYTWIVGGKVSALIHPSFTFTAPGNYTAYLKAKSTTTGCSDSITVPITLFSSPNPVITGANISKGKKQDVYSVTSTPGSSYVWSAGGGIIKNGQGTSQITVQWDENAGSVGQVFLVETNADGCVGNPANKIVSLSPSSISKIDQERLFSIYPNPATTSITIVAGVQEKFNVNIYNALGQLVFTQPGNSEETTLDLNNFAAGMYMVELAGNNIRHTEKLIIQK